MSNVHLSKGWIYGYCFSQGKPIVLMQEHDNMAVHTDVFASHSVLATLGDVRELSSYDFREMNAVYTKGWGISSLFFAVCHRLKSNSNCC